MGTAWWRAGHGLARGLALSGTLAAAAATASAQPAARLTLDRITARPALTGTPPSGVEWSPDGRRLAFLWNDSGGAFRDLWIAQAAGGPPVRLTRFADEPVALPPDSDTSLDALGRRAAAAARPGVTDLAWSPDGASVVIAFRGDLHRVAVEGGRLERLTSDGRGKAGLVFSPDGRHLAFLQDHDLHVYRPADRDVIRATRVGVPPINTVAGGSYYNADVEVRAPQWSPDGSRVALIYVDRRQVRQVPFPHYLGEETGVSPARRSYPGDSDEIRRAAIYTLRDGLVRFLDLPDPTTRSVLGLAWSPDGRRLLIEQDTDDGEHRFLYVAGAEDRTVALAHHDHRPRRLYPVFASAWRSDGEALLFIDDTDGHYRLASVPATGGAVTRLTTGAFDVSSERGGSPLIVSPQTREVFFVSSQKSPYERHVYRVPERGGPVTAVTTLEGVHAPLVSPDGSQVATLRSSDLSPTELYVVPARGGAERVVTRSPAPDFASYPWIRPRYVTFRSRIDGFVLHGRLIEPPNMEPGKRYPVIIGSVYSNTVRNEWRGAGQSLQQFLAQEGQYISLQVDLRGSIGHGVAFREAFQGDWGGGDLEDLHSAVDFLKTLPHVDPDRIGIWGSSYGGMMALFALFERPGMFAAGVAGAPAISVAHFTSFDQHLSRRPNSHPEIFRKSTLLNYGERLQDPLLFIHGLQDDIVPFKTTMMMAEKLMLMGKDFDIAIAPAAPHGWTQREHYARFLYRKLVQHFDRHLGRGGRPAAATAASR